MAAAASSSSSGSPWKYDMFLNFRGEDTRRCFVSHLYKALNQKAINTFIDAEGLRKGNDLSQLLTAIQDSRVSIVVFSQNYASSTWCLKELVQILDCMDRKNQIVVPVFYDVDPSHVRKAESSFAEAFAKHEGHSNADMEEVRSWRSALTRATNLSGWDSKNYEDDAKLIEEIVEDIFQKLIRTSSSKDDDLVEMDSRMHEMELLLQPSPEMDDVRVIGIWGMGGIGKTTIARAVYEKIACQFEACCFLDNVKEEFTCGAVHMQEKFLSRILNEKTASPANNPQLGSLPKAGGYPPLAFSTYTSLGSNTPCNCYSSSISEGGGIALAGSSIKVGTNAGDVGLWEVGSRERLVLRNFKVWDLSSCSMLLQAALVKDAGVSVNSVIWSSDGALFGCC